MKIFFNLLELQEMFLLQRIKANCLHLHLPLSILVEINKRMKGNLVLYPLPFQITFNVNTVKEDSMQMQQKDTFHSAKNNL